NAAPVDGLAGSLATALSLVPDEVGALVMCPVDMPFVTAPLVSRLLAALFGGALAAVPVVNGERGHPVAFARALFDELRACAGAGGGGARAVLAAHEAELALVPWGDPRVLE